MSNTYYPYKCKARNYRNARQPGFPAIETTGQYAKLRKERLSPEYLPYELQYFQHGSLRSL